jgi:geranylgeranylglycerol-phosphate geranylgeranyltransferase
VASLICYENEINLKLVLIAALSAAFTAAAGNVINDILDIEIDKINHPKRPLPSGKIGAGSAMFEYVLLIVIALALGFFINESAFIIVVAANILLLIYSLYLKKIPLIGNIVVAGLTGLVFIYGGAVVENISAAFIPAAFAVLINLIRELIKDMQDVEGDTKQGIVTFPTKFGFVRTKQLIAIMAIILIIFTIYPFVNTIYQIEFFVVVMVIVNPIIVYCLRKMNQDHTTQILNKISNMLKLAMVFGLIAIYLGR